MPSGKPSIFVLGPSIGGVIEPFPTTIAAISVAGRRAMALHPTKPTEPGGKVNLQIQPPLNPGDILPVNVYAFFHQPVESVPTGAALTPDFFFKGGAPSGSVHIGAADADGNLQVVAAGVKPSLKPYFVQTVLEFTG